MELARGMRPAARTPMPHAVENGVEGGKVDRQTRDGDKPVITQIHCKFTFGIGLNPGITAKPQIHDRRSDESKAKRFTCAYCREEAGTW